MNNKPNTPHFSVSDLSANLSFIKIIILLLIPLSVLAGCAVKNTSDVTEPANDPKVQRAGLRSSPYGAGNPFPVPDYWADSTASLASNFSGSAPAVVWIIGVMEGDDNDGFTGRTILNFPAPAGTDTTPMPGSRTKNTSDKYPKIIFDSTDKNQTYLDVFDKKGVKVWLQVEPADADIDTLITLIMDRYSSHPCVMGFGVDVEWLRWSKDNREGTAVTDEQARAWRTTVQKYNSQYLLFFKHWRQDKMPPTERDGLMFLDDSQMFKSVDQMVDEFEDWGKSFYPAAVGFQYGYSADRFWWNRLSNPPVDIGNRLVKRIPNLRDLYWVDFTMKEIWPIEK